MGAVRKGKRFRVTVCALLLTTRWETETVNVSLSLHSIGGEGGGHVPKQISGLCRSGPSERVVGFSALRLRGESGARDSERRARFLAIDETRARARLEEGDGQRNVARWRDRTTETK